MALTETIQRPTTDHISETLRVIDTLLEDPVYLRPYKAEVDEIEAHTKHNRQLRQW